MFEVIFHSHESLDSLYHPYESIVVPDLLPMSVARVEQWLSSLGLREYTQVFIDNGYDDFELCKNLKESDLDLMGITVPVVKAEILNSTSALTQIKSPNASHVYFTVEPNYWVPPSAPNDDPMVEFHPSRTLPTLLKASVPIVSRKDKEDVTDLYNKVINELANDGLVPSQLLTFPLTPRSTNRRSKSGEQMSDSGNDSDPDEIYCAEDLASIYADRLSSSRDLILNVIQRIQRIYSNETDDGSSRNRCNKSRIPESPSCQFTPNRSFLSSTMKVPSLDSSQQYPYSCYSSHKNVTNTLSSNHAASQSTKSYSHYSTSKTLGRLSSVNNPSYHINNPTCGIASHHMMNHTSRGKLGGSHSAVNRQIRPGKSVTAISSCKQSPSSTFNPASSSSEGGAGSSNSSICTSCSREDEISFMYNANISSNTTAEFSSSNSLDSAAFLLPK